MLVTGEALHAIRSLLCTSTNSIHDDLLNGVSTPSWPSKPGKGFLMMIYLMKFNSLKLTNNMHILDMTMDERPLDPHVIAPGTLKTHRNRNDSQSGPIIPTSVNFNNPHIVDPAENNPVIDSTSPDPPEQRQSDRVSPSTETI